LVRYRVAVDSVLNKYVVVFLAPVEIFSGLDTIGRIHYRELDRKERRKALKRAIAILNDVMCESMCRCKCCFLILNVMRYNIAIKRFHNMLEELLHQGPITDVEMYYGIELEKRPFREMFNYIKGLFKKFTLDSNIMLYKEYRGYIRWTGICETLYRALSEGDSFWTCIHVEIVA